MATTFEARYSDVSSGDEHRLSDYLDTIFQKWETVVVIMLVVLALGTAFAFLQTPVYSADAMIQVEDSNNNANPNKETLQSMSSVFDSKSSTSAQIELIRSRLVVEETVRRLHLDIDAHPRTFPLIGEFIAAHRGAKTPAPPLLNLSQYAWGGEHIEVSQFDMPKQAYGKRFMLTAQADGSYLLSDEQGVPVLQGRPGQIANGWIADGALALMVNRLSARPGTQFELTRASTLATVERLQRAMTVAETTLQSGIISLTLEGTDSKLTASVVNSIAREFVQQDIDRKSAEAEHTLAFLEQQLPQLRKELDQAEQRYNTFRNKEGTVDLGEESRLLLQQIVDNKTKLIDLQQQRAELSQRFTAQHPSVAALDAQISALQGAQGRLNRSVSEMPDTEQTALRLLRDVRVTTELYTNLLNNAQQLRIVKAGQIGNVRVVDYAEPADKPVRPRRGMLIALSAGVGLFVGVLFVFARRALVGGVQHPDEIEKALGVPVCAIVPRSGRQLRLQQNIKSRRSGIHVLAAQAPEDIAVEGVRSLRTTLQIALGQARNNVVMLTGSRPDAGKSFLSVNLAALVASANKRVLLIDGDMRRGDIHTHFGQPRDVGFSDVLMGADPDTALLYDVLPGLDVLPKGTLPRNPSELLMSGRLRDLIELYSQRYDLVVIDTPPVLAVTDAALIGKYAGTTLLVIRHGRHPVGEIGETAKRLANAGVQLEGVLLTDVPQAPLNVGGSYSAYYAYESTAD